MFMKLSNRDAFGHPLKFRSAKEAGLTNPILGLGPVLLLDADVLTGSNDDAVDQWDDISGNDNHAVQATEAYKPLLKTGKNGINGHNALCLDGSNDRMLASIAGWSVYRDITMVAVYKSDNTSTYRFVASPAGGAGSWSIYTSGVNIDGITVATTNDINTNILICDWNESVSYNVYQNNVSKGSGNPGTFSHYTWSGIYIGVDYSGAASFFSGLISYIAIFPTQLSTTDRAKVYNFLSGRYLT